MIREEHDWIGIGGGLLLLVGIILFGIHFYLTAAPMLFCYASELTPNLFIYGNVGGAFLIVGAILLGIDGIIIRATVC
jgi:hypothetical protein